MAFLIDPLIPETVLIWAPSNLAASSAEVNIPSMNAVFFSTRYGVESICYGAFTPSS